jgi:putative two-component system response regulator
MKTTSPESGLARPIDLQQYGIADWDPSASEFRAVLSRVALDVNSRLQNGSPNAAEFMAAVAGALSRITDLSNESLRINCLLDVAHYFYLLGQTFNAIEPAISAAALARRTENLPLERKALNLLGIVYADSGNIPKAIECYSYALDIAHRIRDGDSECGMWVNVGVALLYAAQYRDATTSLEHAIHLAGRNPSLRRYRAAAFANIALCCLHLEDFSRGLKAAEASLAESDEPHSAGECVARVLRENNYSRLLLEISDVAKAGERCAMARKYASQSKSARAEIAASIAEGLFEVHAGRVDVGISRLTSTLERARLLRSMLRDALAALVKAYEFIGQPDRALVYLREMMEAMRQTQQENVLKHVKLHLEQLGDDDTPIITTRLRRQEEALRGKIAEQELFKSRIEMLERLAVTAELRDDSTGEHSYRVGKLSSLLAQEFGCDEDTCYMIELAARLHDIGKIGVPDAILLKPDKLNDAECQIMRTHTTVGAELLSKSNIPHMQMAEEIARYHHEWWNGNGYPTQLSGTAIPLAGRITALADVFDALTHKRPYKAAWPIDAALDEIAQLKGRQFDPQLCDLFIVLIGRLRRDHIDIDSYLGQAAHGSPFLQARSRIWNILHRSHDNGDSLSSRLDLQR